VCVLGGVQGRIIFPALGEAKASEDRWVTQAGNPVTLRDT
jgi:hypothetical protein